MKSINELNKLKKQLEEQKNNFLYLHNKKLVNIYVNEIEKIFTWFSKHYPKRHLKWISAMGHCFWVLDDKILYLDNIDKIYKTSKEYRLSRKLLPLVNFYKSINEYTSGIIDIGDYDIINWKLIKIHSKKQ